MMEAYPPGLQDNAARADPGVISQMRNNTETAATNLLTAKFLKTFCACPITTFLHFFGSGLCNITFKIDYLIVAKQKTFIILPKSGFHDISRVVSESSLNTKVSY
jgi:hypothetical protein